MAQERFDAIDLVKLESDSIKKKKLVSVDSSIYKSKKAENKIQLKSKSIQQRFDSINNKQDSIIHSKLSGLDSANLKLNNTTDKVQEASKVFTDSVNSIINKYESKLQVDEVTNKVERLTNIGQQNIKSDKLDSIKNTNPLNKAKGGFSQGQSKIQKLEEVPTGKINEKLELLSKEAGGKGNLPQEVNAPATNLNLNNDFTKGLKLPDTNLNSSIDVTKNLELPKSDLKIGKELPAIDKSLLKLPNSPINKEDINVSEKSLKGMDKSKIDALKKNSEGLSNTSNKAGEYTKDVSKTLDGDNTQRLDKLKDEAIARSPVKNELAELTKQDQLIKDQEEKLKALREEDYKKKTLEKSKAMVAKCLAVYNTQLQEAIGKVSKYQTKAGTILSVKNDMPKKRDPLKRLKMYEKFIPGVTLQVQRPGAWLIDINPSIRYRLTSYWSVGLGWNERVLLGSYELTHNQARVFGVRASTEVVIFKGLSFRLDGEDMNKFVIPVNKLSNEQEKRVWIWSYMAGIKKEFSFIPRVIGNVQFMYNLYNSNKLSPYATRYNVRFGFEYIIKRKKKK